MNRPGKPQVGEGVDGGDEAGHLPAGNAAGVPGAVSNSGLARGGITQPLTTTEINAVAADPPEWLVRERESYAQVRREEQRQRDQRG